MATAERNEGEEKGAVASGEPEGWACGVPETTASDAKKLSAKTRASRADMGALVGSELLSDTGATEENELCVEG